MIGLNPILQAYFPESTIKAGESVSGGLINDTYRVKLDDGRDFILQRLNTGVFENVASILSNAEKVGMHLRANGYAYEFPIPTKTWKGKNHHVSGNEFWIWPTKHLHGSLHWTGSLQSGNIHQQIIENRPLRPVE